MTALRDTPCEACRADSPRLDDGEIARLLAEVPGWEVVAEGDTPQLTRAFRFPGFRQALAFAQAVGDAAEAADHHPRLVVEWGRVRVSWWTHAIGGLHRNDFIMAARTDALAAR